MSLFWLPAPPAAPRGGKKGLVPTGPLPESDWIPPEDFPRLSGTIALDLETRDPLLEKLGPGWAFEKGGEVVGVSIAWKEGMGYWPFGHKGGGNLDKELVLRWLRNQLSQTDLTIVMHNALYDWGWLKRSGVPVAGRVLDTMTMAALIDEHKRSYSLNSLGEEYLGAKKDEALLTQAARALGVHPKHDLWKLPAKFVGPYAEADARITLELSWHMLKVIEEDDLQAILQLEHDLIPTLVEMRWRGVRIDVEAAEKARKDWLLREHAALSEVHRLSGISLGTELWSADAVAQVFDAAGIPYGRTPTGKPSFPKEAVGLIDHPIAQAVHIARKYSSARTKYLDGHILGHVQNGRIHAQFNPLRTDDGGTVSGRLSSNNPNLQNITAKDKKLGPAIRGFFLPEEGEQWASVDYSQQEPRITVHYASLTKCTRAEEAVKAYREDTSTDFHQFAAKLTGLPRDPAKVINLGMIYGMGGATLCRALGLPVKEILTKRGEKREVAGDEGQAIIDQYHRALPFVRELFDNCVTRATEKGFVRTLLGRKCHFPEGSSPHKALNRLVQSSAADMIKKAMIDCHKDLNMIPLVTVHDELGFSVASAADADRCAQVMRNTILLRVPLEVDIAIGPSWGAAQ